MAPQSEYLMAAKVYFLLNYILQQPSNVSGFPGGSVVKNLLASAGDVRDMGLIPGSRRSPGGRHGNPLQYSCLENPMDRGAWFATVHRVAKSWTQLKHLSKGQWQHDSTFIYPQIQADGTTSI